MPTEDSDIKIMLALNNALAPRTAYMLARDTGMNLNTVKRRLGALEGSGAVHMTEYKRTFEYTLNPGLKDPVTVKKITMHLQMIIDEIDAHGEVTADGAKTLMDFILHQARVLKTKA